MKYTDASLPDVSGLSWQISGELELTANPDVDRTVGKRMTAIFTPLNLSTKRQESEACQSPGKGSFEKYFFLCAQLLCNLGL